MIELRVLGSAAINGADERLARQVLVQPKRLALLAYLALATRAGFVRRDALLAFFWPELGESAARAALSQALSFLRRTLGGDIFVARGDDEVAINTAVLTSDVTRFEAALARDDCGAALAEYGGELLGAFHVSGAPSFSQWLDNERHRLNDRAQKCAMQLATEAEAAGDPTEALRYARVAVRCSPHDESAIRLVLLALERLGDRPLAIREYEAFTARLQADLEIDPSPSLAALAERIRRPTTPSEPLAAFPAATSDRQSVASAAALADESTNADSPVVAQALAPRTWFGVRRLRVAAGVGALGIVALSVGWRRLPRAREAADAQHVTEFLVNFFSVNGPPEPPAHDSLRLRVVTASVQSEPADSTLARRVRDSALAEMERDRWLFVVTPAAIAQAVTIAGLDAKAGALPDTIRSLARRLRTHAIVDFGLSRAGAGYVLTAEARSAVTDSSLGVIIEAAGGATEVPEAMLRLGRKLRARLVAARRTLPPTKLAFIGSDEPAEAIELQLEANSEFARMNWIESARRALEATEVDSTFAQAWRTRSVALSNMGNATDESLRAAAAAYRFRSRVRAPAIRLGIAAMYARARGDDEGALVLYDTLTRLWDDSKGWNDRALTYLNVRQYDLAVRAFRRAIDTTYRYLYIPNSNLVRALLYAERTDEAKAELAKLIRADSASAYLAGARIFVVTAARDWAETERLARAFLQSSPTASDRFVGTRWLRDALANQGRLVAFDSMARRRSLELQESLSLGGFLGHELYRARVQAVLAGDTARARTIAEAALREAPWAKLPRFDRDYPMMLGYLASVRDAKGGQAMTEEWSRTTPAEWKMRDSLEVLVGRGEIALTTGRAGTALALFRIADVRGCEPCFYPRYARAFDALGQQDSARTYYERFARAHIPEYPWQDALELANTYQRLGELYEARKDTKSAIEWYEQFTTLWAKADTPVLQARVREVRGRLVRLRKQRA